MFIDDIQIVAELDRLITKCDNNLAGQAKNNIKQGFRQRGKREVYVKMKAFVEANMEQPMMGGGDR